MVPQVSAVIPYSVYLSQGVPTEPTLQNRHFSLLVILCLRAFWKAEYKTLQVLFSGRSGLGSDADDHQLDSK